MSLTSLKDRNLMPNWRPLNETIKNGEMQGLTSSIIMPRQIDWNYHTVKNVEEEWLRTPTLSTGAALLEVFGANRLSLTDNVTNAAKLILMETGKNINPGLTSLAKRILDLAGTSSTETASDLKDLLLDKIIDHRRNLVKTARQKLFESPKSAIRHLDLARAHMGLGNHEKALQEIAAAVALAPHNRYVSRCAINGFLHLNDEESARRTLLRNEDRRNDPWLLAASMSIDLHNKNKTVRTDIRRVKQLLADNRILAKSLSELASSLATLESRESVQRVKLIRQLLRKSLEDPIDNTMAQAQWLIHKNSSLGVEIHKRNVLFDYEYASFQAESEERMTEALDQAVRWMLDKPFSRRAVLQTSNILSLHFNDNEHAIDVLEAGLMANPDAPDLLNNAAYLYIQSGKNEEALKKLSKVIRRPIESRDTFICLKATFGLLEFRMGHYENGKTLYEEAVELAQRYGKRHYEQSARLNYLSEKFRAKLISREELQRELDDFKNLHRSNRKLLDDIRRSPNLDNDVLTISIS